MLVLEKSNELEVICNRDLGFPQEENIVFRAAQEVIRLSGRDIGPKLFLEKNIPMGAGLGGGSSNAAAAINALDWFYILNLGYQTKFEIAKKIGSDVPFFLGGQTARGTGKGEILDYFDLNLPYWILIINPGIHISTPEAYAALERDSAPVRAADFLSILIDPELQSTELKELIFNDFEPYVFEKHPEIGVIKNKLYECGAKLALLSGSGSSVFSFFDSKELAEYSASQFTYKSWLCEPSNL